MMERKPRREKLGSAQRRDIILAVLIIIAFTIFYSFHNVVPVTLEVGEESMTLTGPKDAPFAVEIAYRDILSVTQTDALDIGTNLSGLNTDQCWFGVWRNSAYGEYTLCASPSVPRYIVLETENGVIVCNYNNEDATQNLYTALVDWLAEKQEGG